EKDKDKDQGAARNEGRGLRAELFQGPNFDLLITTRTDAQVDWLWGEDLPDPKMAGDKYSIRWTGWLKAPAPGTYRLIALADDGVIVWLDGRRVIDEWRPQSASRFVS